MGLSSGFFFTPFTPYLKKKTSSNNNIKNDFCCSNFPRDMKTKCGYFFRTEDSWNTEFSVQNCENPGQSEIVDHIA